MGTKLVVYVLLFDVFLAMMVGAYSGIQAPSIPPVPDYSVVQALASSWVWTVGLPQITLIPRFTVVPSFNFLGYQIPCVAFPGLTIPAFTLFSINFGFLAPVLYLVDWIIWIFETIASVIGYLFSLFTSSVSLLSGVPILGPFLTAFVLIVNFILIWELVKLIRGYGQ